MSKHPIVNIFVNCRRMSGGPGPGRMCLLRLKKGDLVDLISQTLEDCVCDFLVEQNGVYQASMDKSGKAFLRKVDL